MKKAAIAALIIVLCIPVIASGQSRMNTGLDLYIGFPHGEFRDNVEQNGFGLGGKFLYNIPQTPVSVGAALSFLIYGHVSEEVPWHLGGRTFYLDMVTTNSIFYGHLMLRLQPPGGFFRPYVDLLGGFSVFSTDTEVDSQNDWDDDNDPIASNNDMRDFTSSYGVGGGIQIRIVGPKSREEREESGLESVYLDFGVKYLKGGEAEYLKQDGITNVEGTVVYDTKYSYTDIIIGNIGVIIAF